MRDARWYPSVNLQIFTIFDFNGRNQREKETKISENPNDKDWQIDKCCAWSTSQCVCVRALASRFSFAPFSRFDAGQWAKCHLLAFSLSLSRSLLYFDRPPQIACYKYNYCQIGIYDHLKLVLIATKFTRMKSENFNKLPNDVMLMMVDSGVAQVANRESVNRCFGSQCVQYSQTL